MEKDKKLISLKEASEISGYSSDYIGQLIRSGKLFGEQVYSNVVWMTTEADVLSYRNNSKQKNSKNDSESIGFLLGLKKRALIEYSIAKIFLKTFKSAFIFLITLLLLVVFLVAYIFFSYFNPSASPNRGDSKAPDVINALNF